MRRIFFFRVRQLGDLAQPLQPALCIGIQVIQVKVFGWGEGGALVYEVVGGLFLGSAWAGW